MRASLRIADANSRPSTAMLAPAQLLSLQHKSPHSCKHCLATTPCLTISRTPSTTAQLHNVVCCQVLKLQHSNAHIYTQLTATSQRPCPWAQPNSAQDSGKAAMQPTNTRLRTSTCARLRTPWSRAHTIHCTPTHKHPQTFLRHNTPFASYTHSQDTHNL
jgi:hypothetical protein